MSLDLILVALGNALQRLAESLSYDASQPLVVDASIQRFEFCIELTWKTLKKALAAEGIEANTPRECMSQAYAAHWLADENGLVVDAQRSQPDLAYLQGRSCGRDSPSPAAVTSMACRRCIVYCWPEGVSHEPGPQFVNRA